MFHDSMASIWFIVNDLIFFEKWQALRTLVDLFSLYISFSRSAVARTNLGSAYFERGDEDAALHWFREAYRSLAYRDDKRWSSSWCFNQIIYVQCLEQQFHAHSQFRGKEDPRSRCMCLSGCCIDTFNCCTSACHTPQAKSKPLCHYQHNNIAADMLWGASPNKKW